MTRSNVTPPNITAIPLVSASQAPTTNIVSAAWGPDTWSYFTGYLTAWSGGDVAAIAAPATKALACARTILEADGSGEEVVPA
jgi:hypothetical protein